MDHPYRKSQRSFEKNLGKKVGKLMTKSLKGFDPPQLLHSSAFTRCGNYIILYPDVDYYAKFQQDRKAIFMNHQLEPYLFMLDKLPE